MTQIPYPPIYQSSKDWERINKWMYMHLPTWNMVKRATSGLSEVERTQSLAYHMAVAHITSFNENVLLLSQNATRPLAPAGNYAEAIAELRDCRQDAGYNREQLGPTPEGEDAMWDGFLQGLSHAILRLEMTQKQTAPKP